MDRKVIKRKLFVWYFYLWILLISALYISFFKYIPNGSSTISKWVALFSGSIAMLFAACKGLEISYYKNNNKFLHRVVRYFSNGAFIYNFKVFKFAILVGFLLVIFLLKSFGSYFVIAFVSGMFALEFLLIISIVISSRISAKLKEACIESSRFGLKLANDSGIVVATSAIGLSLVILPILFHTSKNYYSFFAFALGAILVATINNVSMVISKRAADSTNSVVTDFIAPIGIEDKRNPLLLLDGVSKGIFKVNILASDLFISFVVALAASVAIGNFAYSLMGQFLPIVLAGLCTLASIIALLFVRKTSMINPVKSLYETLFFSIVLQCIFSYVLIKTWLPDIFGLFYAVLLGSIASFVVCYINSYFASYKHKAVKNIANISNIGFAPTFIQTLKEGFIGTFAPCMIIALAIVVSFLVSDGIEAPQWGLYGISLSVIALISNMAIIMSSGTFALISNSCDTVVESYEEEIPNVPQEKARMFENTGFHIISLGKNFINIASILTALITVIAYTIEANIEEVDLLNPYVITAILFGAITPFVYCSSIINSSIKTTKRLIFEIKKQFRTFPQILRFEMRPNYEKCVDIAAFSSMIQAIFYTSVPILMFVFIYLVLKNEALSGYLIAILLVSFVLMIVVSTCSISIRGVKKYFENELTNLQNSNEYNSISINDALFKAIKDVIVPILNNLIKFMAILALALVTVLS